MPLLPVMCRCDLYLPGPQSGSILWRKQAILPLHLTGCPAASQPAGFSTGRKTAQGITMKLNLHAFLSVCLTAATPAVLAGSLECQGNIISPGVTEAQLLEACGEPTSRNGADLIYKMPGDFPMVVTLGNGVVMFIRDATDLDSPASPLGDTP